MHTILHDVMVCRLGGGGRGHRDGEGVEVQWYPLKERGQSVLSLQHDLDTLAQLCTQYVMAITNL